MNFNGLTAENVKNKIGFDDEDPVTVYVTTNGEGDLRLLWASNTTKS